jgi:SOS-response transcriptional repressor LexA
MKRFYHEGATVRLKPSNPEMEDIVVPAAEVEVRGVVVGLMRKYKRG